VQEVTLSSRWQLYMEGIFLPDSFLYSFLLIL
jgi:hypothetical protein